MAETLPHPTGVDPLPGAPSAGPDAAEGGVEEGEAAEGAGEARDGRKKLAATPAGRNFVFLPSAIGIKVVSFDALLLHLLLHPHHLPGESDCVSLELLRYS